MSANAGPVNARLDKVHNLARLLAAHLKQLPDSEQAHVRITLRRCLKLPEEVLVKRLATSA